jgi:3-hydroxyacyl-[acyl-carrier-protein] dehydratase
MKEGGQTTTTLELSDILQLLPHRYPFLLVDRIVSIRGDESAIGIKNVTYNEPFFQGHFPGNPVMPGVLLVEGLAQTGGAICSLVLRNEIKTSAVYFLTIDKAKFRRPVVPGDVVEYHLNKIARRKLMWWYRCEARVGGKLAVEAVLGAMMRHD